MKAQLLIKALITLFTALTLNQQAQAKPTDYFLGTWVLVEKSGSMEKRCYSQIEIKREFLPQSKLGKNQDSLGFYARPAQNGAILSIVPDINQGEQVDEMEVGFQTRIAEFKNGQLLYLKGHPSDSIRDLSKGQYFKMDFKELNLFIELGTFSEQGQTPDAQCVYLR